MKPKIPLFVCFLFSILQVTAGEENFPELALRVGIDGERHANVQSYELIHVLTIPRDWALNDQIKLDPGIEFGIGALNGEGRTGLLAHLGPAVAIKFSEIPLSFILSSGPAVLTESEFDPIDLGGSFQFMSAAGFDLGILDNWSFGYRFLHISNAGLHDKNPGLNLHALNLSHRF